MRALCSLVVAAALMATQDYPHAFPREGVTKLLDTARFTLWEVHWKMNTPQPFHRHLYDMAGVYLRFGKIAVTTPDGQRTIGEPWPVPRPYFQPKGVAHKEEAVGLPGDPERFAIMVDLKDLPVPSFTPRPELPTAFPRVGATDVLDNTRVRMWDYTWEPGRPVGRHVHETDSVVVFVTGGTLKTTVGSRDETVDVHAGTAVYAPRGRIDAEEAVGKPVRAIVIELK
jgi:quercetin dioxygenase-like cupin family protein